MTHHDYYDPKQPRDKNGEWTGGGSQKQMVRRNGQWVMADSPAAKAPAAPAASSPQTPAKGRIVRHKGQWVPADQHGNPILPNQPAPKTPAPANTANHPTPASPAPATADLNVAMHPNFDFMHQMLVSQHAAHAMNLAGAASRATDSAKKLALRGLAKAHAALGAGHAMLRVRNLPAAKRHKALAGAALKLVGTGESAKHLKNFKTALKDAQVSYRALRAGLEGHKYSEFATYAHDVSEQSRDAHGRWTAAGHSQQASHAAGLRQAALTGGKRGEAGRHHALQLAHEAAAAIKSGQGSSEHLGKLEAAVTALRIQHYQAGKRGESDDSVNEKKAVYTHFNGLLKGLKNAAAGKGDVPEIRAENAPISKAHELSQLAAHFAGQGHQFGEEMGAAYQTLAHAARLQEQGDRFGATAKLQEVRRHLTDSNALINAGNLAGDLSDQRRDLADHVEDVSNQPMSGHGVPAKDDAVKLGERHGVYRAGGFDDTGKGRDLHEIHALRQHFIHGRPTAAALKSVSSIARDADVHPEIRALAQSTVDAIEGQPDLTSTGGRASDTGMTHQEQHTQGKAMLKNAAMSGKSDLSSAVTAHDHLSSAHKALAGGDVAGAKYWGMMAETAVKGVSPTRAERSAAGGAALVNTAKQGTESLKDKVGGWLGGEMRRPEKSVQQILDDKKAAKAAKEQNVLARRKAAADAQKASADAQKASANAFSVKPEQAALPVNGSKRQFDSTRRNLASWHSFLVKRGRENSTEAHINRHLHAAATEIAQGKATVGSLVNHLNRAMEASRQEDKTTTDRHGEALQLAFAHLKGALGDS